MEKYKKIIKNTKDEYLNEAKRYLENSQKMLKKAKPKYNRYQDIKYVRSASGIAYLAATSAVDGLLISKGISSEKLPKNKNGYLEALSRIGKNGKLGSWFENIYDNLHVWGYYRGISDQIIVETAFGNVRKLIDHIAK